jgi:hypothetical protein
MKEIINQMAGILNQMNETTNRIVKVLKRSHEKRRIRTLLRRLPGELQSSLMYELLDVIDMTDRREKLRRTREIFAHLRKEELHVPHQQEIADCQAEYLAQIEKSAANILAPDFPMARIAINHDRLEQKARAKLTLQSLEEEIMLLPQINTFHLFAALLGVLVSTIANYMTIASKFGNDWIGGNEIVTAICNIFFSLLLNLFEAIGLYLFLHFIPQRYGKSLARLFGIIGSLLIVFSIVLMIFSRTEIGSTIMTGAQALGKVE